MQISNYYCGSTDKISGFVYDTEQRTYKEFTVREQEWIQEKPNGLTEIIPGFHIPGEIEYFFQTKRDMLFRIDRIKKLGFTEDAEMVLDFGTFNR